MKRYLVMLMAVIMQLSVAQNSLNDFNKSKIEIPNSLPIVQINTNQLRSKIYAQNHLTPITIHIPFIAKTEVQLQYHPLLSEDFQDTYPDIRVYKWIDEKSSGTVTISPEAIYINKLDGNGLTMLYPTQTGVDNYYRSNSSDPVAEHNGHECVSDLSREAKERDNRAAGLASVRDLISNGDIKRTYRLAPIVTGEYYQANGGTNASVAAHLTNGVAAMEAIFENDLAINFALLTPVLYNNPATDPFEPDQNMGVPGRADQALDEVVNQFASASYDFGHVFHHHETDDGWSTGGVAYRGVVCDDQGNIKAGGWSGSFNNNGVSWIQLACHEIGHMFGAEHTFNGEGESCQDAISTDAAYEIGSGTTIMSYQGICGEGQNITASGAADSYFHVHSLIQMLNHIALFPNCPTKFNSNNNPPVININPCNVSYKIPRGTPFIMTAEGSDPDGDLVTYTWEQYDEDGLDVKPTQGEIGNAAAANTVGPLFRSFPPSTDIARSFPTRETVIEGNGSDPFQVLPGTSRMLNFKLTARDNRPGAGGIAFDDRQVQVTSGGPFRVTSPNNNMTIMSGDALEITWDTGGSDDVCSQVDIYLSIDGGFTTPYLLANDVDYSSGVEMVNIPSSISETSKARIMIICDDNPCVQIFDLSNNDFTIQSGCSAYQSYLCNTDKVMANQGDQILNLDMSTIIGERTSSLSGLINPGSDIMTITTYNTLSNDCIESGDVFYESDIITPTVSGEYVFAIDIANEGGFGFISLFTEEGFSTTSPCSSGSFISSSGRINVTGTSASSSPQHTVELEACTRYIIAYYNTKELPIETRVPNVSGPGEILIVEENTGTDYSYTYVAVNTANQIVSAQNATGDFTTLGGGSYNVYGISYKSGGITPPSITDPSTWIGQSLNTLIFSGNCILQSQNFKPLEIFSSCSIDGVSTGGQSACDANTNSFEQDIVVEYSSAPTTGNLIVNGSTFPLSSSPQGLILENLFSDGLPVDLTISFSDDPSCESIFPAAFTAPENCCPIMLELGDEQNVCESDMLQLDSGPDGETYQWTLDDIPLVESTRYLTPTTSGLYSVTVTNSDGCAKSDQVTIVLNANPEIQLASNSSQCQGELATLNPNVGDSNFNYSWSRGGVFIADNEIIEVSIPGEYCIDVTNPTTNCLSRACTTVEFVDAPVVSLGDDMTVCESVELILNAGDDGTEYNWKLDNVDLPETSSMLIVEASGIYSVSVMNGLCSTSDEVSIDLIPAPAPDLGVDFILCEGDQMPIEIQEIVDEYVWLLDGVEFTSTGGYIHFVSEPGEYVARVSSGGCEVSDTVVVTGKANPIFDLGEDRVACVGSEVILDTGIPDAEHAWFIDGFQQSETGNVLIVDIEANYRVLVIDMDGCRSTDMISIDFEPGPTLDIGESFDLCDGVTQTVVATTNGDNITWYQDGLEIMGQTDFMLEVSETGEYVAEVSGTSGCIVEDQISVNVFSNPEVNIDPTRLICDGEFTTVIAGDDDSNTYLWTDEDGMTVSLSEEFSTDEAGVYTVLVTNTNNCSVSDQVEVIATQIPTIEIDNTHVYCEGSSTVLTVNGVAETYEWEKDGEIIIGETTGSIEVNEPGVYFVTGTNGTDCSSSAFTTVSELANPSFDLGENTELCPGDNLMLTINESGTYAWSTLDTDQSITIDYLDLDQVETTITATLTTDDGCTAMDEIIITRLTNPTPQLIEEATICEGDTIVLSVTASDGSSTEDYQWTGTEGTFSNTVGSSIEAYPTMDGTYTVTVVNGCGVSMDMASVMVFIDQPSVDLSAGRDTCIVMGRTIQLDASGGDSYEWDDNETFVGSTTGSSPEVMPLEETTYTVIITNENGCTYTDEITVCVIEDPFSLLKPISLITPNEDGMNDWLEFKGLEAFPNNRLRVYNRWGVIIFDRTSYQNGSIIFDGTRAGGEKLPPDTYYYILEIDEKVVFKQNLTIVRS